MHLSIERFWAKVKTFLPAFVITILTLYFVVMWILLYGYSYEWTGFGESIIPLSQYEEIQPYKTLWDWLGLLVIPLALALSAALFSLSERRNERKIAEARAQDAALQSYLEQMSIFLIDKELRKPGATSEVRVIARAWTLTFLRRLNGERKGVLLQFLYESELIIDNEPIISLKGANLINASLERARLERANLVGANLAGANLYDADLKDARLEHANLAGANLESASLDCASLVHANLARANLKRSNLYTANLAGAKLQGIKLKEAKYDESTRWPSGFEPERHGAIREEI